MPNERRTEEIVRRNFQSDPLYGSVKFEEQKPTNVRVVECLVKASKSGRNRVGKPEFVVTFPTQNMDCVIVVECKADVAKHESPRHDRPKDYAVDGALHYAKFLSVEFSVIAVAVSGETEQELVVSNFLHKKGEITASPLPDTKLLSIYDYVKAFRNEQFNYNLKDVNIVEKAVFLNNEFQSCSITESMRNTLVSGILLALQDDMFKAAYPVSASSGDIARALLEAIERVLRNASVRKLDSMMGVYCGILNEPLVTQESIKKDKKQISSVEFFKNTISYLQKQVYPLMRLEESGYDILGRFYTEFIRYAASRQKQGLVLTPSHVTDLFCDLADLNANDVVYDPCCGTGGFLIAAMRRMVALAGNDDARKNNIRKNQLLGVEVRSDIFTFACSNMMLRGDGKSNIDRGDCFTQDVFDRIEGMRPTVAFLNPPYDQGTADQLRFVETALKAVAPQNGRVVAVVQMSCALKDDGDTKAVRKRLLERNTLKAVVSMPDDLFYPIGVVTCVMVFDANSPNDGKKTWFGYLKNDGFVKRKNKGRIDFFSRWTEIKTRFLEAYKNSEEVAGLSVKHEVTYSDEWCAEAYMQTDYSKVTASDFEAVMRDYAIFRSIGMVQQSVEAEGDEED